MVCLLLEGLNASIRYCTSITYGQTRYMINVNIKYNFHEMYGKWLLNITVGLSQLGKQIKLHIKLSTFCYSKESCILHVSLRCNQCDIFNWTYYRYSYFFLKSRNQAVKAQTTDLIVAYYSSTLITGASSALFVVSPELVTFVLLKPQPSASFTCKSIQRQFHAASMSSCHRLSILPRSPLPLCMRRIAVKRGTSDAAAMPPGFSLICVSKHTKDPWHWVILHYR